MIFLFHRGFFFIFVIRSIDRRSNVTLNFCVKSSYRVKRLVIKRAKLNYICTCLVPHHHVPWESRLISIYVNFVLLLISSIWTLTWIATCSRFVTSFFSIPPSLTCNAILCTWSCARRPLANFRHNKFRIGQQDTYPCVRGRWSALRTCSEASHRSGLQSEHSCSSSSCSSLVTRRNEISIAVFLGPFPSLFSSVFGCSRNFVSCPRSFCSVHSITSFPCAACRLLLELFVAPFLPFLLLDFLDSVCIPVLLTFDQVAAAIIIPGRKVYIYAIRRCDAREHYPTPRAN